MNQEIINKFTSYLAALPEQDAFAGLDMVLKAFLTDRPGHIIYYGSDPTPMATTQAIIQVMEKHEDPKDAMSIIMALLLTLPTAMIEFADLADPNPQLQDLKDTMGTVLATLRSFEGRIQDHLQSLS